VASACLASARVADARFFLELSENQAQNPYAVASNGRPATELKSPLFCAFGPAAPKFGRFFSYTSLIYVVKQPAIAVRPWLTRFPNARKIDIDVVE
jgi:hypothetical protein